MTTEELTPKTANTDGKICGLKKDHISTRKSWIMVYPKEVHICNQKKGEIPTGIVTLTKKEFERFIKFYETGI